ncbi:hypothetical protein BD410DRAFT_769393 [Rickenella mellea]|uniref:MI domain-containing protein n=1 Tax=Rickenella mellea TaxID=50990 RepID=A0A4Y7Q6N8_9AGAM|nr:hypothetical protein BD410DRAFT_769393 [Rickenella mellea]
MSKSSTATHPRIPAPLSKQSAWANGPPQRAPTAPTSRSQSPAPVNPTPTHSRRPSALSSSVQLKDGVSVPKGVGAAKQGGAITFGSVNDQPGQPTSSPPEVPATKSDSRPVTTFGSISTASVNGKATPATTPPTPSASSSTSTTATPSTVKSKVDVASLFRGGGASGANTANKAPSPAPSPYGESVASPSVRPAGLPTPHSAPQHGQPGGPGPHQQHQQHHQHPHPQQPMQMQGGQMQQPQGYPQFVPQQNLRAQNVGGAGNIPRSPRYTHQMQNGSGPGGGVRTPGPGPPQGPNAAGGMPSPRLGPQPQHTQQHQHQQQQHQQHQQHQHQHQQPGQPMAGMPPPPMQWPPYYYGYMPPPGSDPYMAGYAQAPQPWMQMHQPMTPMTPQAAPHGLPVASPRPPPPPPLQPPATPPAGPTSSLQSPATARLNTHASAFVPGQVNRASKVIIKDASGHEVDLAAIRKGPSGGAGASGGAVMPLPAAPSTPSPDRREAARRSIRMESEEERKKRLQREEEEAKAKAKKAEEEKAKKEAEERKVREEEERKRREEEEAKLKAEEEKKRKEEERLRVEAEAKRKAEEEERLKKEEAERKRKEEEAAEAARLKAEEEERVRKEEEERRKAEEEKERIRKEEEEKEKARLKLEEEEKKRKEEEELAAVAAKAAAVKPDVEIVKETGLEQVKEDGELPEEKKDETPAAPPISTAPSAPAASLPTPVPTPTTETHHKRRPVPGPINIPSANRPGLPPSLPSALATARHIQDLGQIAYPEGVQSPKLELNANAKDGKFRYDRDFLLQFMKVCTEKPDNLPPLDAIGLEPADQSHPMGRGGSGRRSVTGGMGPPSSRPNPVGLGIMGGGSGFGKQSVSASFSMGQFSTPGKRTSEDRFNLSNSMSGGVGMPFGGPQAPMVRTVSSGSGRKRASRAKEPTKMGNPSGGGYQSNYNQSMGPPPSEPLEPLQMSKDRWKRPTQAVEPDSPELVDRKVRALLNKLTMEKFDSISNQLIQWANKSEKEKDGRTLIQVIRLVFEKATDEATWSEMYARLCRKMMEQISPNVQDDGIRNADGNPIAGGLLFRKYLLNRCQEDFERGWKAKESTAAAAATKATEDQAAKEAAEKDGPKEGGGEVLYSIEYYAAQKAKRQGLGLVKFIGELFKLQMLTERIMHECIKKLLSNVDNPEEEEIESLCKLLSTVGQALDTTKARGHMDVYFSRMKELATSNHVSSRMQFMLQDAIELRERKWIPRNLAAAPTTIAQVHEAAAKEKAQQEKDSLHGRAQMSRGGSRRGHERGEFQTGPDGWAVAGGSNPPRPPAKAGDLTNFGKITKATAGSMQFGPSSVFTKKDGKGGRDQPTLSRTSSSQNMFSMLSQQTPDAAADVSAPKTSRPPSRKPSVDLSQSMTADGPPQTRPKLNLLPRTKPNVNDAKTDETPAASEAGSDDEGGKDAAPAMSEEEATRQIGQDVKEFFAIRNLEEAETYWTKLPVKHRFRLVDKLVTFAIESKEADAKLVAEFFDLAVTKDLCPPASFEDGFLPTIEILDDIAIDAPKAFDLMIIMLDGSKLDAERRKRLADKSADGDRLLTSSS